LLWSHSGKLFHLKEQLFLLSSNLGFIIFLFSFLFFVLFCFFFVFFLLWFLSQETQWECASLGIVDLPRKRKKEKKNFKTKYPTNANQINYYLKVNTAKNTHAQIFPMKKKKLNPLFKSNYHFPIYIIFSYQRKIDIEHINEGLLSLLLKI
jgi:hypothetical protein